jgi:hypothetical protein
MVSINDLDGLLLIAFPCISIELRMNVYKVIILDIVRYCNEFVYKKGANECMSCNPSKKLKEMISQTTGVVAPGLPDTNYDSMWWKMMRNLLEVDNSTLSAGVAFYQLFGRMILDYSELKNSRRVKYELARLDLEWLMSPLLNDSKGDLKKTIQTFVKRNHEERRNGNPQIGDFFFTMAYLFEPKNQEQERRRQMILSSDLLEQGESMSFYLDRTWSLPRVRSKPSSYINRFADIQANHDLLPHPVGEFSEVEQAILKVFLGKEIKDSLLASDLNPDEQNVMEKLNLVSEHKKDGFMTIRGSAANMMAFKLYVKKKRDKEMDGYPFINIGETTSQSNFNEMLFDSLQEVVGGFEESSDDTSYNNVRAFVNNFFIHSM